MLELRWIEGLELLRSLDLTHNPLQQMPDYRTVMLLKNMQLTHLDGKEVRTGEKVAAINKFTPPQSVVDAIAHSESISRTLTENANMQIQTDISTDPNAAPVLVITGARGVHKHAIVRKLIERNPDVFQQRYCVGVHGVVGQ